MSGFLQGPVIVEGQVGDGLAYCFPSLPLSNPTLCGDMGT